LNSVVASSDHFPIEFDETMVTVGVAAGPEKAACVSYIFLMWRGYSRFKSRIALGFPCLGALDTIFNPQISDAPVALLRILLVPYGRIAVR
jgi:hypothetical protein